MRAFKTVIRRRVLINLVSGRGVEGVLIAQRGPLLFVKDAKVHEPGASGPAPADGELVIERSKVDFIQAL